MGRRSDDAIGYALDEHRRPAAPPDPGALSLTPRERRIARLVAQGLSNKQIAAQLFVSRRTAESHVQNVLRKLGFTSRAQIAAWISER